MAIPGIVNCLKSVSIKYDSRRSFFNEAILSESSVDLVNSESLNCVLFCTKPGRTTLQTASPSNVILKGIPSQVPCLQKNSFSGCTGFIVDVKISSISAISSSYLKLAIEENE